MSTTAPDLVDVLAEAATTPGTVVFYSRHASLRLVRKPLVRTLTAVGTQQTVQEGLRYQFTQGVLKVTEGQDVMVDGPGWLRPGLPQNVERDAVQALRDHRDFNVKFYEAGNEPGRPLPTDEDFLALVSKYAAELDVDGLVALYEQESASHKRPLLLTAAKTAITQIEAARAEYEAAQAESSEDAVSAPENGLQEPQNASSKKKG